MTSTVLLFARGAVVLAFALLAVRLLRRSPATLRYLVLATALFAVLVLPLIEGAIPTWHTGALATGVAAPIAADLPLQDLGGVAAPSTHAPILAAPADVELPWTSIAGGLWLLGLSLAVFRVGYGAVRARLVAHRGSSTSPRVDVTEVWRSLGGRGEPPRIVGSSDVDGPIVVGALAPIVVVPRNSTGWSADRWRIVLLHELAHVRQRDGLINLVAQLACCLHWINPLAWIAASRLREERELAADDAVLRAGARASSYAEHLVELATGQQSSSVLAMAERSRFEARVVALLDADRPRRTGWHRAVAVIAASALVTVGVACVSPDSAPVATEASPAAPTPKPADNALQIFVEKELDAAIDAHQGTGAVAVVLDAKTGKPLAIASRGELDARTARTPGSTIKPFTFAAALEAGTVDASTKIDCENGVKAYGSRTLRDSSPNGTLDLGTILAVSSNVCTAKLAEPLGDLLGQSLRRYRIAAPERVDTRSFEGAAVAFGEGVSISPLALATAYTALADGGIHHAVNGDGVRVMREDTARTVLGLMEHVVVDSCGTGQAARLDGVRVAGKTGTTRSKPNSDRHYASFVGIVPADAPRFVILVGVDGVTSAGGKVAAPVFATIATRVLR